VLQDVEAVLTPTEDLSTLDAHAVRIYELEASRRQIPGRDSLGRPGVHGKVTRAGSAPRGPLGELDARIMTGGDWDSIASRGFDPPQRFAA
jgi:hypothetical protein